MIEIEKIKPQEGFQDKFTRSTASIVFGGGSLGGGKTMGLMLALAPYLDNPDTNICLIRKTYGELKTGGGILDEIKKVYEPEKITESKTPTITMSSGAKILLMQVQNENRDTFQETWKGSQFSIFGLDELTGYQFETFTYLLTRNRSRAGYKPLVRCTTNPKYNSWVRIWLQNAGYIGDDGYIKPEMDGAVKYFYVKDGRDVRSVIWGDTKEEVYLQHKEFFDHKAKTSRGRATWGDFILDFAFYRGDIWGNRIMLDNNPNYIASVASSGEYTSGALLDGNWLIDPDMWDELDVSEENISHIFDGDPQDIGEYTITADIALSGKDNFIAMAWKGLHLIDMIVLQKCTANQALNSIRQLQARYGVPDRRTIFDGVSIGEFIGGAYGIIKNAISFKPQSASKGLGKHNYANIKSQCADKLITFIKNGNITVSKDIGMKMYENQHMKYPKHFRDVFFDEIRVLRLDEVSTTGKMRLIPKEKQKEILGGRSPDIVDNFIYLCYFYLDHTDSDLIKNDERLRDRLGNRYEPNSEILEYLDDWAAF